MSVVQEARSTHEDEARRNSAIGLALGMLGVAIFSLTLPMTRIAVAGFDPLSVVAWRGLLASAAAILVLLAFRPRAPGRADWPALLAVAFGVVLGFPLMMTIAMRTVSASYGGVVLGLLPLATASLAALLQRERPSPGFWLVSLAGSALTIGFVLRTAQADGEGGSGAGVGLDHLLMLAAVAPAAVGYAAGARAARSLGGWQTICWALAVSAPFMAVGVALAPALALDAPASSWIALLYLALMSQLTGFFAWYRGLALGGVARVSQTQLAQLFLTLAASAAFLGEPLDPEVWLFGAATVACVALSARLRVRRG